MTNRPFFTIVIPTYNRAAFLRNTIMTVLNQSFGDFELIVVDDGSSDNTQDIVGSIQDARIHYIKIANGERGAARNAGFRRSQGEYINFLDSDDCLYPHHLMSASEFIETQHSPPIFHLAFDVKDETGKILRMCPKIRNINQAILNGNVLSCNGVFIRSDVMKRNLFNEDRALAALEDWELWIRMSARYLFHHIPKITSTVIQHDQRSVMTKDTSNIAKKVAAFIQAVSDDPENRKVFGKGINKVLASANTYAALHIALTGKYKSDVVRYFLRGIHQNPLEIFAKRSLVIMKWLFLK